MDSNSRIKELIKKKIIFGKYQITKTIDKRNNLQVYEGKNISSGELLLIKFEQKNDKKKKGILETELQFLNKLKSPGFPEIKKIGYFENNIVSIQALLGQSLSQLFNKYYGNFKIKDITMIAIQILERIKHIHSQNILYCDISPNNFAIGIGRFQNIIYMTNFNSAKKYTKEDNLNHIKFNKSNNSIGNYIFSSINALRGIELSRRDDLESLGYILIYFLKGELPWENIKCSDKTEKKRKIYQIKKGYDLLKLCDEIPEEFKLYLNYVKSLKFTEEPDYNYCFSLFYGIFKKMNIINDGIFSWFQEKKEENQNKIKQFYNKLWFNKSINKNTSACLILNNSRKNDNDKENNPEIKNISKSNSCFLNVHNSLDYILNNNKNNLTKILSDSKQNNIYKEKENYSNNNKYQSINKKIDTRDDINEQKSIELPNIYIKESKESENSMSLSSDKEYSIEGKIEQDVKKNKTYEKKQIRINFKKSFNKKKDIDFDKSKNKKNEINQNDLLRIQKRINNKKQNIDKIFMNKINKKITIGVINKTFTNKDLSTKNMNNQTDILYTENNKKYSPSIKSGTSSEKTNYLKNRIKYFTKSKIIKDYSNFTNVSQMRNKTKINDADLTNSNINNVININENYNTYNTKTNTKKKQKKKISLNIDNLVLNSKHVNDNNKESIYSRNFAKKNQTYNNSYQNSLNNLSNKKKGTIKKGLIKVVKKNINKVLKIDNNEINNDNKNAKMNIYEHKSFLNKYSNTQPTKKYIGVLMNSSKKKINLTNTNTYNNTSTNTNTNNIPKSKKPSQKMFKSIPLSRNKDSKKEIAVSLNKKNTDLNRNTFSSMSSKKKTIDNEIDNERINYTQQNIYNTVRNNNTIFYNFNNISRKKKNINEYYIYKTKKLQNISMKNKPIKKSKEFRPKYVKIENNPIIHNSISKLNLIQNVSNIYVTKSYLEEKPLTERKNKVLISKIDKNKNIYIKPKTTISHDWTLLDKGNIDSLIFEINKDRNYRSKDSNQNTNNYYYSEFNIFNQFENNY